jgi:protoporphyrinogen oxidase
MQKKIKKKNIVILGGGLAGLSAADYLLRNIPDKNNYNITIIEKQKILGGLASSVPYKNTLVPRYYHHVIANNKVTRAFLNRFNLLKGAVWKKINVAIAVNGSYSNITKPIGLLRFKYLSLYEKIRFGLFGLYTIFVMDPKKIPKNMDAKKWLYKYAGKQVAEKIFYHLYAKNKFNTSLDKISAKQFANRLKEREVYEKFTYPPLGLQPMIDRLKEIIEENSGTIITSTVPTKIDLNKNIIEYKNKNKNTKITADHIINTIPIPEFLKITTGLPTKYKQQLGKLKYCPAVCIIIATKDFLDKDTYWFNLFKESAQVIIQHSVLIDKYKEKISWVLRYGGSEEDLELSNEEVKKKYLPSIKKYFPKAEIVWSCVTRDRYGEPVYDKNYADYMPKYRTPVKNLYIAGIQATFPKIRNMNSALESGIIVAKELIKDLIKQ